MYNMGGQRLQRRRVRHGLNGFFDPFRNLVEFGSQERQHRLDVPSGFPFGNANGKAFVVFSSKIVRIIVLSFSSVYYCTSNCRKKQGPKRRGLVQGCAQKLLHRPEGT